LAQLIPLNDESREKLTSLQAKRTELRDELKLLRAKKPKVNPMADELFASLASMPVMNQMTEVIPRPESVATLQGNNTTVTTTVTKVPPLESAAAVQGHGTCM
jgi:predicted nuclease with TOPRIM domain